MDENDAKPDVKFINTESFAQSMDVQDPLRHFRKEFHFPKTKAGTEFLYFTGNSLGLQPRKAAQYVQEELQSWADLGVRGHLEGAHPWLPYHELLTEQTARLVGALPLEVVVMNTLSVNLHLMMVSFFRPQRKRSKILMEAGAFPSDQYAVASQLQFHGIAPQQGVILLKPRKGENTLRTEDILQKIKKEGDKIALVLLGSTQYLTGQAFDIPTITAAAHARGCKIGWDLAHGVGNLKLELHDWAPDFAVWCSYKYLNGGPGSLAGCFVHQRHDRSFKIPRFAGWWGHNKKTRFAMPSRFDPLVGAEGWQLSNPPILQLAALRASMELFDLATMARLRKKSSLLTGYLEFLLKEKLPSRCQIITPPDPDRGAQLSLRVLGQSKLLLKRLEAKGVLCDLREPDIIRAAPAPLYCRFTDVYRFSEILKEVLE